MKSLEESQVKKESKFIRSKVLDTGVANSNPK